MTRWTLTFSITPEVLRTDPVETGTWVRRMLATIGEPAAGVEEPGGDEEVETADESAGDEQSQVDGIVRRWQNFAPTRSDDLAALVGTLRELGFTLALSRPRSGGEPRSYLRVLLPTGENLGFLSSASFSLVEARTSDLAHDPLVEHRTGTGGALRYPRVDLTRRKAFDLVVRMAEQVAGRQG
jgi:hypothetical protein